MSHLVVNGASVKLRADGRLEHLDAWSPAVAEAMARREGPGLTEAHWNIIIAMREYYQAYNILADTQVAKT